MFTTVAWIAEGFLALFFALSGAPKILGRGIDRWVGFDDVPRALTVLIGTCEIAAAIGLVVPLLVRRGEWTTPLAGLGIAVVSLMASGFHLRNREWLAALETLLWATLACSVAAARWDKFADAPSLSRQHAVTVAMIVVVPAVLVNLVVLARTTVPSQS